ncbi:regulation of nuclear pre-mRNA domain-containing protein 2 isoform X3 [Maniola jurtina]|uniref:regulation of nuclear pre-mRNA domain-containing protein 2 isoform X3 n=1 Tax=Maniola jurtina TaxID=191418 RepID=UPI001E68D3C8|nr:regulation of nuclear pre-mRNA domain-containing protein 2 isoform X3 [Maniola jurtina]
MGETEEFNTLAFEKKLTQLKDTQESIQSLSSWCLKQRLHHKKIVSSWLNVLKRVKVEQRLVLFYLANDVIQYSKRKNYEFVESWGLNLQKATPLVRDEKVRSKILRIFKIWEQRSVYDDEFLSDLTGLLSAGAIKKADDDPLDFQPQQLVNKIKQCTVLEADTQTKLKYLHEHHLELSDADALCANLKDRGHREDVEKELNEGISCVEKYTQALQREIVAREALLALLSSANQYYSTQRGEVKVVAYAYKNFGARVRALKRKLDELIPTLPSAAPSPPQRDEDVPSPGPDEDLDLPAPTDTTDDDVAYNIDQTFNTSLSDGSLYNLGLSSFLTSDNPLAMFNDTLDLDLSSANKIEVINTRPSDKQDFDINDILKGFDPLDNNSTSSENNSAVSISQKSLEALPGLDLLTPDSTGIPPPPTSFYGTMETIVIPDEPESPYLPEALTSNHWNNNWNVPPPTTASHIQPVVNPRNIFVEPPASPPHPAPHPVPPPLLEPRPQDPPIADVDHRGILPPPPPPPVLPLLGHIEDVDHRMLPTLAPPPVAAPVRHTVHQDVDHRNLISLTQQLPVPRQHNSMDQDYRVPPMVPPPDIVESVDMDLSEDEEQQGMYGQNQIEHRRHSFNNNKVLVGGDNDKQNHKEKNSNLIQINSITIIKDGSQSAPVMPLSNPFDNMPDGLKFNMPPALNQPPNFQKPPNFNQNKPEFQNQPKFQNKQEFQQKFQNKPPDFQNQPPNFQNKPDFQNQPPNFPNKPDFQNQPPKFQNNQPDFHEDMFEDNREENSDDSAYEDDLRSRSLDNVMMDRRNPSPEFEDFAADGDWSHGPRPFLNQRFPRNWGPRTNFRPQGFSPMFRPRNGPRPQNMGPRWGPRPQRFW